MMDRPRDTCPISGLPVVSRPEWAYHNPDTGCHLQVSFVGERIVWSRVAGYIYTEDADPCADLLARVVDEQIPPPQRYVHIADCQQLRGGTYQTRRRYDRLLGERSRLDKLVLYGLSPFNSLLLRMGARIAAPRLDIVLADSYAAALERVAGELEIELSADAAGKERPAHVPHLVSDPEWTLRTESLEASFEVLDGDSLLSTAAGHLEEEDVDRLDELRRSVLEACGLERFRYVLASLGGLTGITPRARRRYVDSLREWHARHPVDAFIFYDASPTIRAAIALGRPFLSFRSLVARDRRHALELLEEERARHRRAHLGRSWLRRLALRRYRRATVPVDVLLEYLGGIDWSKDGKPEVDAPTRFPRAHEVFDAIDLIKQDLDQTLREREAAREEARRGQQFLRAALERLPEGVVLLDDSGHVALANPTAEELLPLVSTSPADEPLRTIGDRPVDDFLSETGEKRWHELVLEGPPRRILEIAGRELEGGARVLVMWDMTRERTVQRQLQQQERLAAVGQLAAGIAHDFNNILQGILLTAYRLAEHDDEEVAQSGTVVARQAERGARLIRQILDFGRRSVSRRQPLDLAALLDDLVPLLSRTIPETVKIVVESSGGPHWISGDTAQLEQLVTNLTLNARDAMPTGGQLSLSLRSRHFESLEQVPETGMRAGDWVDLVVRDTGVGIAPEDLERIFEPFFSTKSPTEGTGLGLAQVYGIVKQHEAYVSCASRVGEGTTFHFYFPRIKRPAETSGVEAGAKSSGQAGHHILVVEDDRMIRRLVAETLQSQGHDVVTAGSGEEALAIVDETARPLSLVLTDVVMPDLGGVALCRELRQRSSETRLLVMSGYPLGQDLAELRALGVGGWLEKPFSMQALTDKVNELLERPPARRDVRNTAIRD